MNFAFSNGEESLRSSVQAFLEEHLTDEVRSELLRWRDGQGIGLRAQVFLQTLNEKGWLGLGWPKEFGGKDGNQIAKYIVEEEFYRAAAMRLGGGTGAPAILASGTEEQKRYYLPKSICQEITFCLGFSEPNCGTDLAGVRCLATRKGDHFVIKGQKTFTSDAQSATNMFLLARTDPNSRRQAGLSVFLVPMDTPGIDVRPMWTIQSEPRAPSNTSYAEARVNEVFFDDVLVPENCLLGEEGDGWNVTQRGLNLDRIGAWRYLVSVMRDEDIVNLLKSGSEWTEVLRRDPRVRDTIAEIWTEGQVCRLMTMRSITIVERGGVFVYEGAAEKVWAPEHGVRATEVISQILGPYAQLLNGSPYTLEDGVYAHNLLGAFQSTVNHGSVQVMRDQIARKGLGMPRPTK
jgi:alkylation response protein AidB-like acyl-CoA dehydrogenase